MSDDTQALRDAIALLEDIEKEVTQPGTRSKLSELRQRLVDLLESCQRSKVSLLPR